MSGLAGRRDPHMGRIVREGGGMRHQCRPGYVDERDRFGSTVVGNVWECPCGRQYVYVENRLSEDAHWRRKWFKVSTREAEV